MSYVKTGLGADPIMAQALVPQKVYLFPASTTNQNVWIPHLKKWVKPPRAGLIWVVHTLTEDGKFIGSKGQVLSGPGHWEGKKAERKPGGPTVTVVRNILRGSAVGGGGAMGGGMYPGGGVLPRMGNISSKYLDLLYRAQGSEAGKEKATAAGVEWSYPYGKKYHLATYVTKGAYPLKDKHTHPQFHWGMTGSSDYPTASALKTALKERGWTEAKMDASKSNPKEEAKLKKDLAIIAHDYVAHWTKRMRKYTGRKRGWEVTIKAVAESKADLAEGKRDHRTASCSKMVMPQYVECCEKSIRGGLDVYEYRKLLQANDPKVANCMRTTDKDAEDKKMRTIYLAAGALGALVVGVALLKKGK